MSFDPENYAPPGAKIKVIGVGGGGGNAVNTMIRSNLDGVDFITANTDMQALRFSLAPAKLQVGKELTRGLGAGADPDIGRDAALEDRHEIQEVLAGADMVFITAGMGGGTGTGGASVVAQIARELGALTVAVVTKPFTFEGKRRRKHAESGIARLRECVDTLITIPNQRLLQVATPGLSMIDAFKMADDVLVNAVRGISDIINIPGMVNVDFADVKTVMSCMGQALMGIGSAAGEGRAVEAARQAISSPLLEDIDIEGATGILINITAGSDVTLMEVNEACSIIQEAAHEDANIIFGTVIDETLGGGMRVTVIATGFPVEKEEIDGTEGSSIIKPATSTLVSPYATRLTTPNLTSSAKPAPRPATITSAYPLTTKKPEAPRPMPTVAAPVAAAPAAPVAAPAAPAAPQRMEAQPAPASAPYTPSIPVAPVMQAPVEKAPEPVIEPIHAPITPIASVQAAEEAQELTRWTLDGFNEDGPSFGIADDIPSLASPSVPPPAAVAAPVIPEPASAPVAAEPRLEGARVIANPVNDFAGAGAVAGAPQATLAETLFDAGEDFPAESHVENDDRDERLLAEPDQEPIIQNKEQDNRPGAVKEAAPLETFFEAGHGFLASDIDRKIDEALELAERMRHPRKASEGDDLDVPAFLRNGMKDLPLD